MSWAEIEKRVSRYRGTTEAREVSAEDKYQERLNKWGRRQGSRLEGILLDLGVENHYLRTIRDEVWQEGSIEKMDIDFDCEIVRGFRLVSEPIRIIGTYNRLDYPTVGVQTRKAELAVSISAKFPDEEETEEELRCEIGDSLVYDLRNRQVPSIDSAIVGRNWKLLLRQALELRWAPSNDGNGDKIIFDPTSLEAPDKLAEALFRKVELRKTYQSIPSQIRDYEEQIISQFPQEIRNGDSLHYEELEKFVRDRRYLMWVGAL